MFVKFMFFVSLTFFVFLNFAVASTCIEGPSPTESDMVEAEKVFDNPKETTMSKIFAFKKMLSTKDKDILNYLINRGLSSDIKGIKEAW